MKNIKPEPNELRSKEEKYEKLTRSLLAIVRDAQAADKPKTQFKQLIKKKIIEDQEDAH